MLSKTRKESNLEYSLKFLASTIKKRYRNNVTTTVLLMLPIVILWKELKEQRFVIFLQPISSYEVLRF